MKNILTTAPISFFFAIDLSFVENKFDAGHLEFVATAIKASFAVSRVHQ